MRNHGDVDLCTVRAVNPFCKECEYVVRHPQSKPDWLRKMPTRVFKTHNWANRQNTFLNWHIT